MVSRMSGFAFDLMNSVKEKKQGKLLKKLSKYEKITDNFELEITEYVTKLAGQEMTKRTSRRLRSYLNMCNDLERIGDLYFQMSKILEKKINDKVYFLPEQRNELNALFELIDKAFGVMTENIASTDYTKVDIAEAQEIEGAINGQRDKMKNQNLSNLGSPEYNVESSMIYNSLFSILEKIGDHIINVSEDIAGNPD